ncbi:MAG: hypothetical protein JWP63_3299, partial [Candidatus Solibacter sp.]|nr:hypothetical protein [Candidatus Solibacter sp.]
KIASGDVGPSDKPAVPTNEISAYVGGLRQGDGEFDINVAVPKGAGPGDLVTLFAGRQAANAQTAANLPLPDGFATVASLADGTTVCCFATHKLIARAVKQGGSAAVIYDLVTGDVNVVTNPENVTSIGPPAGQSRVVLANAMANTISAVAYNGNRQVGIMVIRIP